MMNLRNFQKIMLFQKNCLIIFNLPKLKRDAELEEATLEYTAQISDFGGTIEEMKEDVKFIKNVLGCQKRF